MLRRMAQDYVILYLMLMAILGLLLGIVGSLLIYIILSWHSILVFLYSMFARGVT